MVDTHDEFRFLASDAARVGRTAPLPQIERVFADVVDADSGETRRVSGLHWQPTVPAEYLFLHGAGLNAHSFDPTVLALDAPALALDLPGHGRSDWRSDARYLPTLLAADITQVITNHVTAPLTLVGHSLGGMTAAVVAQGVARSLIRELFIIDVTPAVVSQRSTRSISEFITGQRDYGSHDEIVDRAIAFGIGSNRESLARGVALNTRQRADGRWEWTHHFAHLGEVTTRDSAATDRAGSPATPTPDWEAFEAVYAAGVPLTLVAASAGLVTSELAAEWSERLPQSRVVTLTGSHNLHEAAPRELAQLLATSRV